MHDNDTVGSTGTIRFETLGHSVEIDVGPSDTVKSIMDRLRSQAGDWLYVNYFDQNMGNVGYLMGNTPVISIAAKDGSAVNVIDVKGTVAQDQLLLNTSIQGSLKLDDPIAPNYWQTAVGTTPPSTFSITVAGYTHTIDLTAMRDINGNGHMDATDLVATINARMQDYDVRAELNKDGCLVLWSPRGYSIEVEALGPDASVPPNIVDITDSFLGTGISKSTPYRGGYDLQGSNATGYVRVTPGIYTQNVVTRSGANQTRQNFFGVLDDIAAAVRAENRDGLSDKLLPKIDAFTDNVLKFISASGALQIRYESNKSRMNLDGISMTDTHDRLFVPSIAELTTQLMMAQTIYQASLGVISYIVQPTLLNYLR